jgi:ABC-2 type transport system permease protein
MTGTVFDIGYQHYEGAREGAGRIRLALVEDGLRTALGLGRGVRAKALPWFFIVVLCLIALIMAMVVGATDRLAGPGAADRLNLPNHSDFYGIASILLYVFAANVAPELLCRDRRDGVLQLYLVRPVTGTDYVFARWAACMLVMTGAAWLPQCLLFAGLAMGAPAPGAYLAAHWLDVPRFLLAGLAMAAYVTALSLLVASFTTRRAYAAVFLVGLFVISTPFTVGMAEEMPGAAGQWVSMFNLTNIPVHVNDVIFGVTSEITEDAPASRLPAATRVAWCLGWTVAATTALWARYRRAAA